MKSKVDIVIRADGSKQIGMGHIGPMVTLAKELVRKNVKVEFVTFGNLATDILRREKLSFRPISSPTAYYEIKEAVLSLEPRLIIKNTWKNEFAEHFDALKSTNAPMIGFHQLDLGLRRCEAVINPLPSSFVDDLSIVIAKYYQGPGYLIINDEARKIASRPKEIADQMEKIIVAVGGTDAYDLGPKIKKLLEKLSPKLSIELAHGWPQQKLFQKIHEADLAICGGGNSIFESAFFETPAIGVAQEEWEEKSIRFAEKNGVAIYGGFRNEILENLSTIIRNLDLQKRTQMSAAGKRLVDGNGLERIVAIIEKFL